MPDSQKSPIKVFILYSTVDGHTLSICKRIQEIIEAAGHFTSLACIDDMGASSAAELAASDRVLIGASIRYGKHRPNVIEFIRNNRTLLNTKLCGFFTVNLVARKAEKNTPETNPYVQKLFDLTAWQPQITKVFAGKLDYQKYGFFDRTMIRLIMKLTQGPTEPTACVDYTNWEEVSRLATDICETTLEKNSI